MPASSFETVSDLAREGAALRVRCRQCGHPAELSARFLQRHCDVHGRRLSYRRVCGNGLAEIAARLKCTVCGARDASWEVVRHAP